jgi:hypothetical protein
LTASLYRLHELAFRTQYAELKERVRAEPALLPGTPGALYERTGTGHPYWYRVYYAAPGRQVEDLVGARDDSDALDAVREQIDFAKWVARQVADLRKLEFQVADKSVARVLVELHNLRAFEAGLIVVGTLCYTAWLNEMGVKAVSLRTQDVDLARRQRLKLDAPLGFLEAMQATKLPFAAVAGLSSREPPTSVKLPGVEGLRVDLLAAGRHVGAIVAVPELRWHAQAIPHYDYLLAGTREGAILAGGHCVPVRLPAPERLVWHKLFSSATRAGAPEKAAKDLIQAVTLAAVLVEQEDQALAESARDAPAAVRLAARKRLPTIRKALHAHPLALEQIESGLG